MISLPQAALSFRGKDLDMYGLKSVSIALLVCSLLSTTSNGRTWYIKPDGTGDAATIQAAIDASAPGDTVLVAPGTYHENLSITGSHNGICVLSNSGAASTTIIAKEAGTVVDFAGVDTTTTLKGFTLTGGTGAPNPEHPGTFHGGGVRIFYCSPRIIENHIINNSVEPGRGGGIQCFGSSAIIEDNVISGNSASFHGGGIHVEHGSPRIDGNTISNNQAWANNPGPSGGGISAYFSTIVISNNSFKGNKAKENGGAVVVDQCSVQITRNIVTANQSGSSGGGVFLFGCTGELSNNTVVLNRGGSSGGFAFLGGVAPSVQNNIVVCNSTRMAGGIGCDETTSPDFICNDVWNNSPSNYGGCADQTGQNGNISADPLFCHLYADDFSPAAISPVLGGTCGTIGAVGEAGCSSADSPTCEFPIGTKTQTWGGLKGIYKK